MESITQNMVRRLQREGIIIAFNFNITFGRAPSYDLNKKISQRMGLGNRVATVELKDIEEVYLRCLFLYPNLNR